MHKRTFDEDLEINPYMLSEEDEWEDEEFEDEDEDLDDEDEDYDDYEIEFEPEDE